MTKPIKNNSKLLYLQARQMFERAKEKFENGTIQSEPQLIASVFSSFQEFFTSMGKPNMVPRYAPEQGPPWSEDYNSMMHEIMQDLELLFQEIDILSKTLYSDFNHNMIQQDIITKQFESVLDKMNDLEVYEGRNESGIEIGRDNFLNKDKIDYERIAGTPLEIVDGAVTLPQVSRQNVARDAKITIVTGNRKKDGFILGTESNGFPGNNTEIHSVTDDILTNQNYIPTFIGEENSHNSYSAVLDGSPNTWFEYEKVNVREHDRIRSAKNLGWDYQVHGNQSITWAEDPEDGTLKLHMQIILDKEEIINQINCNMYTPPNYGAQTAVVKNILVADEGGVPKSVMPKNKNPEQYSFFFSPVKAKVVSVIFEQSHKYITDIGHIFYEKKMQVEDRKEYAMDTATRKKQYAPRVEGPLISLEDLGIQVNVSDNHIEAKYPLVGNGEDTGSSIGETINRLMRDTDTESTDIGIEKFEGFRWCIGIRDIEIFSCEYAEEGELVTHPFYFEKPVDKISIDVNENIPTLFTENDSMKYNWLTYYVSIDDGATWYPITPLSHEVMNSEQPPKVYTVQTIESSQQQLDNKRAYLESEYPVYSIRIRMIGRRPTEEEQEQLKQMTASSSSDFVQASPIINNYMINIESVEEPEDSEESNEMAVDEGQIGTPPVSGFDPDDITPIGGGNPWGDDNGDGVPNWRDPTHPDYVTNPPEGWQPPGNPGTYPQYPLPGDNYEDEVPLSVRILNKKDEWCFTDTLILRGKVNSSRTIEKVELIIDGTIQQTVTLNDRKEYIFTFTIKENTFTSTQTITAIVRAYDNKGEASDISIINMIDCEGLPPEDRPNERDKERLNVIIDSKPTELFACDELVYYGSAQGPNPIQSLVFRINDIAFDPNDLGTPPKNDPCGPYEESADNVQPLSFSPKKASDEELLAIEDFGDWLEAFEEREGCKTCQEKRRRSMQQPMFQQQATPFFFVGEGSEETFFIRLPYWKLREFGANVGETLKVEVTAIDSINEEASDHFFVTIVDDSPPQEDENGNPRVRDCYSLDSIELHYYNQESASIDVEYIPHNMLPYDGITNGAGVGITVGWNREVQAPVIMQTSGRDESGYTFQIHAVGVHYFNEYDQHEVVWMDTISHASEGVHHIEKILGDASKDSLWIEDIYNGDYSTSPSFSSLNDYVVFFIGNDWVEKTCDMNIENFDPLENEVVEEEDLEETQECNEITHVLIQTIDEQTKQLKIYRIDVTETGRDSYIFQTKNGETHAIIGWSSYFNGPAIQIQSAIGSDNLLLTAVGVVYINKSGQAETSWSTQVRYKTNGVQYPEFAIGVPKKLENIDWIENGVIDYGVASLVGGQGDITSFLVEDLEEEVCEAKNVDELIGISPMNPPDVPTLVFENPPESICIEDESMTITAIASDNIELKSVQYGITVNEIDILGPYEDESTGGEHSISFSITPSEFQVGDLVRIYAKATNLFGIEIEQELNLVVETCDEGPPVIELSTSLEKKEGKYCYHDLINEDSIPLSLQITDDQRLYEWSLSQGEEIVESHIYEDPVNDTGVNSYQVAIQKPERIEKIENTGKVDIVFIFDTSGSMAPYIENMKTNLEQFKQHLIDNEIDAYMGYVDSNFNHQDSMQILSPASEFNLDAVSINSGTWENLGWGQLTDTVNGGLTMLPHFREGATRFFIAVTDTHVTAPITQEVIDTMLQHQIQVSFVQRGGEEDYATVANATGGSLYNLENPNFGDEIIALADDIVRETTTYYPDESYTIKVEATDFYGKKSEETITFNFTDCLNNRPIV